ncbi:MAG TPA: coatomer subunit epsilon, partial [Acidobacteriaceae bacterium]|nr:coatomer subunit epsilon [Acidobacteriaceae bacterium]
RTSIVAVLVLAALIAGLVTYYHRSDAAELAFGAAIDTYSAPLAQPGQPATPGEKTFATAALRAKAANEQFNQIAERYGMLRPGRTALYFAGVTALEMGQTGTAETDLQKVADSHDTNLAALAKLALAGLYQNTNRDSKAVVLYQQLIAKPTTTVPANAARLQLAALYETTNPAEAQRIYAQLKSDRGAAGQIAAQKLTQK